MFSPCRKYRYDLTRHWGENTEEIMVFIGCNPSTADATNNDPTVTRAINLAYREFCGGMVMLNLFALRGTDPNTIAKAKIDTVADNDFYMRSWLERKRTRLVLCWGAFPFVLPRAKTVLSWFLGPDCIRDWSELRCLGVTQDGHPKHPLYLRKDVEIVPYPRPAWLES